MASSDIIKWADEAMFEAAPMKTDLRGRVSPQVFLLSATPDPLGALAAGFHMYAGRPTYDLADITDEERMWAWEESLKTHLKAPWEFIDFHFFIEGVTRAFTHQIVRQRTAVYAQESLRFAVKEGFASEVAVPPGLAAAGEGPIEIYTKIVKDIETAYMQLVNAGVPAEDARGLLPHCVTTRLNYKTNFRGLIEHAGNRLCTQAQFEWRSVFLGIMKAIRDYVPDRGYPGVSDEQRDSSFNWQFRTLAKPIAQTFTPVCYKAGKCVFMGKLDRGCTIRDRVQAFAENGIPSTQWGGREDLTGHSGVRYVEGQTGKLIPGIRPEEWMADVFAGITTEDNVRPEAS